MRREDEELSFLAETKLEVNPDSFEQIVKEAFQLEHGATASQDIAELIGKSKGRVSQMLKYPKKIEAATVEYLLSALASPRHRKIILQAWIRERFGEAALSDQKGGLTGSKITEKTLRRVDRQIREMRLWTAADTALEAARKASDPTLKEQLLDRAYFTFHRLDEPGHAMSAARLIAENATERRHTQRLATAQLFRARILSGLVDLQWEDLEPILERVSELLAISSTARGSSPYFLAEPHHVAFLRIGAYVAFVERGAIRADEQELGQRLSLVLQAIKGKLSYQRRFNLHLIAARIYVLLGNSFQAHEHVELAFRAGQLKNLHGTEICGLIENRILRMTEDSQTVAEHLAQVSRNCRNGLALYQKRMAECDLAKLESTRFP